MSKIYDVIVLGAGPAGLAAGLYAGRSRLSVLIVEKGQDGGQISITELSRTGCGSARIWSVSDRTYDRAG